MNDYIKYIDKIIEVLLTPTSISDRDNDSIQNIEHIVGHKLPNEVVNLLIYTKSPSENISDIFFGYEAIGLDGLAKEYQLKRKGIFFRGFNIDSNFIAPEGYELKIFNTLTANVEEDIRIYNLRKIIPLFDGGSGFYICLFFNTENTSEIIFVTQDYGISSLAPTLIDHLVNLKLGINKGVFDLDDDLPTTWYERLHACS